MPGPPSLAGGSFCGAEGGEEVVPVREVEHREQLFLAIGNLDAKAAHFAFEQVSPHLDVLSALLLAEPLPDLLLRVGGADVPKVAVQPVARGALARAAAHDLDDVAVLD